MRTMSGWVRGALAPSVGGAADRPADRRAASTRSWTGQPAGPRCPAVRPHRPGAGRLDAMRTTPALTWVSVCSASRWSSSPSSKRSTRPNQPILLWSSTLHAAFYFYTTVRADPVHVQGPVRDARRAVRHGSDLHRRGLGLRVPLYGVPGRVAGLVHRGHRAGCTANLVRAALPLVHDADPSTGLSDIVPVVAQARSIGR